MGRWMPIETAPHDGTWVLLGWAGSPMMVSAQWSGDAWVAGTFEPAINVDEALTYWRPLPVPPEDAE